MRPLIAVFAALILGSVWACSPISVEQEHPAPPQIKTVVIDSVKFRDPADERLVRRFQRGLQARLASSHQFDRLVTPAPAQLPPDSIVITGKINEFDEGSEALRFLIGYGLGGAKLRGRFRIADASGKELATFEVEDQTRGETGFSAAWNPLDMDRLVDTFAADAAKAILRWSKGQSLQGFWWL